MVINVLIVDDSAIVRTVLRRTLSIAGFELGEVLEASNGREALALLAKTKVDIVFTDINMPEMNGVEMVEEMEQSGYLEAFPVVVISTERSETRVESLKKMGVKAYIKKPFTPEKVKMIVDLLLRDKVN